MNQPPPVPALGLTLAQPRERVQRALEAEIGKGYSLIKERVSSLEQIDALKRQNWDWTLSACNILKECFTSETVALYFSASVYVQPSLKLDDLERELDEFPHLVGGRIQRLQALLAALPVVPEPPCGDYLSAQFHPRIYRAAWRPFELAQYGPCVAQATQEVEDAVKEATFGNITTTGVELVKEAFDPESGPLSDKEAVAGDNQAICDLFTGFMGRYRNLPPHAVLLLEIKGVARILSVASYLMYIVDERKPKEEKEKIEFELLKDDGF
jgi:hypothetical protein